MWLLSLTAGSAVTPNQDHTFLHVTEETSNWRSTEYEASTFKATSAVADIQNLSVAAVKVDETSRSATTPLQGLQFAASTMSMNNTMSMNITASLNNSGLTLPNESTESTNTTTEPQHEDTAPPLSMVTNQTSEPSSAVTWMPTSPDQNQSTERNAESTSDNETPTSPSQSTKIFSTPPRFTEPVSVESTSTNPSVTTDDIVNTSPLTTRKRTVLAEGKDAPQNKPKKRDNPGTIVASIIGGALVMMIIGFIAIFVKRKKYKQQQVMTKDWAGPSPFLENSTDNGHVNLTSSNRISFSSFLPQRLSRKLSLLPEEDQELEEIMTGTTFGGKQEAQFLDSEQAEDSPQESNGTASTAAPEVQIEGTSTGSSSQANEAPSMDKNSEVTDQNRDDPERLLSPSGPAEDSLV